jgi:hypothetical protein
MNIYKIKQYENNRYDTYDSAVVVAESEEDAKRIHPDGRSKWVDGAWKIFNPDIGPYGSYFEHGSVAWTDPKMVKVTLIGVALADITKESVICSSYNAG